MTQFDQLLETQKDATIELVANALSYAWKCNTCPIRHFCNDHLRNKVCQGVISDFLKSEVEE